MAALLGDLQSYPNSRKGWLFTGSAMGCVMVGPQDFGKVPVPVYTPYCAALFHSMALRVRLDRSTMLSHSGWYEVVFSLVIPSDLQIPSMR